MNAVVGSKQYFSCKPDLCEMYVNPIPCTYWIYLDLGIIYWCWELEDLLSEGLKYRPCDTVVVCSVDDTG